MKVPSQTVAETAGTSEASQRVSRPTVLSPFIEKRGGMGRVRSGSGPSMLSQPFCRGHSQTQQQHRNGGRLRDDRCRTLVREPPASAPRGPGGEFNRKINIIGYEMQNSV